MDRQSLVDAIEQKMMISPSVRHAFASVDRALFVPAYYAHKGADWILEPTGEAVYEDHALTTQMTNGLPSSSSSQPSIMAAMLEALDVQPGMRVLEVGAGTGYNAALLAFLVGADGQVVSIDIDPTLVQQARSCCGGAGVDLGRARFVVGDGRSGSLSQAPYDRIIVTAGFRHLPLAWLEQLTPEGILVGNKLGSLVSVLIRLQKDAEEPLSAFGTLLPQSASFMEIHGDQYPQIIAPDWKQFEQMEAHDLEPAAGLLEVLKQDAFLFFLQGQLPRLQVAYRVQGTPPHHQIFRVFMQDERYVLIKETSIEVRGGALYEDIEYVYRQYQQLDSPELQNYTLSFTHQTFFAAVQQECWCIS